MPRKRAISPDRLSRGKSTELDGKIVKSVQRAIEIFELFSELRTGATVADIATMLDAPPSSTSALLRSLYMLGYLELDTGTRTYRPLGRLGTLDCWAELSLVEEGPLIAMVRQVAERTGYSSYLIARNKLNIQLLFRSYGTQSDMKTRSPNGSRSFITQSVTGLVLLSDLDRRDLAKVVTAVNARLPEHETPIGIADTAEATAEIRRTGHIAGPSRTTDLRTTLAFRLPEPWRTHVAFGISIPTVVLADVGVRPYVDLVTDAMSTWLRMAGSSRTDVSGPGLPEGSKTYVASPGRR